MPSTPQNVIHKAQVNATDNAKFSQVVTLSNGNVLVAYSSPKGSGDGFHVYGQLFSPDGDRIGEEFEFGRKSSYGAVDVSEFQLVAVEDNRVILAREHEEKDGEDPVSAFVFEFGQNAPGSDGPERIIDYKMAGDSRTTIFSGSIAATDSENFHHYAMGIFDSSGPFKDTRSLHGHTVDNGNSANTKNFKSFEANSGATTDADTLSNGNYVVIVDRDGDSRNDTDIHYRIHKQDGTTVASGESGETAEKSSDATVTALEKGGFVIAWTAEDGDTDVRFELFDNSGESQLGPVMVMNGLIGSPTEDNNNEPVVVPLVDGGFIVFADVDNGGKSVYGQRFDKDGQPEGEPFRIDGSNATDLDATLMNDGRVAVTWDVFGEGRVEMEIISFDATDGDDEITGDSDDNVFSGLDGDDEISGRKGNDLLIGRDGDDVLWGGQGNDELRGGNGNDSLFGHDGDDELLGGNGEDLLRGGDGDDTLRGEGDDDTLDGGAGDDRLFGGSGNDLYIFEENHGNDEIINFNAALDGEKIDLTGIGIITDFTDLITNHMSQVDSDVVINTGAGNSILMQTANLGIFDAEDFVLRFQSVDGTDEADVLVGTEADEILRGFKGDDRLDGGAGDDILYGGTGSDLFEFGDGSGHDEIRGYNATNDKEKIDLSRVSALTDFSDLAANRMTQVGDDVRIDLGGGNDLLLANVNLEDLDAEDFIMPFQSVEGTDGADDLVGTEADEILRGFGGDDRLDAGAGDDILIGGAGSDIFVFSDGHGADRINDFDANDNAEKLDFTNISAVTSFADLVANHMTQFGSDVFFDFGNGDLLTLSNVAVEDLDEADFILAPSGETIIGTDGNDTLTGTDGDDVIEGLGGRDTIFGGDGNDVIDGGRLRDVIDAGAGNDTVIGGLGPDEVHLGDGDDIFQDDTQGSNDGADTVFGGAGNDTFFGGGGFNTFTGGAGDDTIHAGAGSETFVFASGDGNDLVIGFDVDADVLDLKGVTAIDNAADLNAFHISQIGNDVLIFDGEGLTITLQDIDLGDLDTANFILETEGETFIGTDGDDTLTGTDGADVIEGLDGRDTIFGGDGNDLIDGGRLRDVIDAGAGNDTVIGGVGPDVVHLGDGNDIFQDDAQGFAAGADTVFGGAGNDTFFGGGGSDIFDGGAGDDTIHAGAGSETFVFATGEGSDLVIGFDIEADVLDLSGVAAISDVADLNAAHMSQIGNDVRIADGQGLSITLQDIDLADLGSDNFILGTDVLL